MYETESLLARIHEPADLKNLSIPELNRLASEIRETIVSAVSKNGGHLASNLGVVELTVALHRAFNSPSDKIVWDVGHQCYTHKLLTGRFKDFGTLRKSGGLAGFPKRAESKHDVFDTGHASTSISAALGILAGERLNGNKNRVIAVIGDGALTGGLAFEALSHAGQLGLPLIVILNDNKMCISPNVGGLSKYLSRLSMKSRYQSFRRTFDSIAKKLPFIGDLFFDLVVRLKRAVKAVFYTDNFFVDLGFEYVGPIEGHNIQLLEDVLKDVRSLDRPVVVHVITQKGKGYGFAENDPGTYHGVSSFSATEGLAAKDESKGNIIFPSNTAMGNATMNIKPMTFTEAFSKAMLSAAERDSRVIGITAAMERGTGLSPFKTAFPKRFFDVGIAEEHAVTFAAGLASQGLRPVTAVYSTFIQRSIDQVIHDVAIQNLPVIFALDRAGFVCDDGETHQGLYDISLFRTIPNMTILSPSGGGELKLMLDWALGESHPVMIRYPKKVCPPENNAFSEPLEQGRGVFVREWGGNVCIAFTGSLFPEVWSAAEMLLVSDISCDLYNLRFLKPVDEQYLADIMNRYEIVVFIEEGVLEGGFGEYASELAARRHCKALIYTLGVSADSYVAQGKRDELLCGVGLDAEGIYSSILQFYAVADRMAGLDALRALVSNR